MAGKGSAPGERRGGRQKGGLNKATIAREAVVAEQAKAKGQLLAKDAMAMVQQNFLALAAKYRPSTDADPNPLADEKKFTEYLDLAGEVAGKLAPYQSPRFASVTITRAPLDLSRLSDKDLHELRRITRIASVDPGMGTGRGDPPTQH